MAVIRDMIPSFELFQPTSVDEALDLLSRHDNSWVLAGGLDSMDWFKDRIKRPEVVVELSHMEDHDYDRLGTENNVWPILGVDVPLVRIPLQPGRNIASLIEVVARNQLLKYRGHNSALEFQAKIDAHIKAQSAGNPAPKQAASAKSQQIFTDVE